MCDSVYLVTGSNPVLLLLTLFNTSPNASIAHQLRNGVNHLATTSTTYRK